MAEVLVNFNDFVASPAGHLYKARACGREMPDGRWEGWLEFEPAAAGETLRSARETTQPNRTDTAYWATGLTPVYLEGALARTLEVPASAAAPGVSRPAFDGPLPYDHSPGGHSESVLNPFSVYRKGEDILRSQLNALAAWHLVNIIEAHDLSRQTPAELNRLNAAQLTELIIAQVRASDEALKR